MNRIVLFSILISLFAISCRKQADQELPVVVWNSPSDGIQINVYDTLHVSLHLTDNAGLENLDVKLLDVNLAPVLPTINFALSGREQDVTFDLPVSSIRIASGVYYLYAEVSDANNLIKVYRTINITAVPRELKGFFVATNPITNSTNVFKVDTSWSPISWANETNDFTDLAVSSYWQQVYINGNSTRIFHATSIDGLTAGYSINPIVSTQPFWGPMSICGSKLWVSYRYENKIKSLDENGLVKNSGIGDIGFYPLHSIQIGNKFFSEQKDISSSTVRIVAYTITGPALQETILGMDAVAMFEKDADNVYVVGNANGQGHLKIYDVAANGMWEPIVLPAGLVTSATQIDSNTLLIAMNSGTIYKFTYTPVGLLTWASGINSSQLRYNDVDDNVFSAEGLNVKVYNYNPFSLQRTIPIQDSIRDLELWYNR